MSILAYYVSMIIAFFKNETHFCPRVSYTWENAERVDRVSRFEIFYNNALVTILGVLSILMSILFISFDSKGVTDIIVKCMICLALLPLHEMCHVLFCVISRRRVDRICFFPNKFKVVSPYISAYVKPSFGAWNKIQSILLCAFPLIILTVVPLIIALFVPQLKYYFIYISIMNIFVSSRDIFDIIGVLYWPQKAVCVGEVLLLAKDEAMPIVIHQLFVTPSLERIHHKQFTYFDGKLVEQTTVEETHETTQLRKEFAEQFGVKE